eukprot:TRINITY_DN2719_c0_g2_i11.p1 TRINITY_DN2719_c0_g2~~TRINITY_DN2719_c0_g2_i11.p1  ORF type:complete len:203 (+),score=54.96 TRINITY_DN2719_c0_g2_i11:805-1413(+)
MWCTKSDIVLDGGNFIDNGKDKAIVTKRIFKDNPSLLPTELISNFKTVLGIHEIAFVEEEGDCTGHIDGMAAFLDENTLVLRKFQDLKFRETILREISENLTNVKILEMPKDYYKLDEWRGFESARGIYVNSIVTPNFVFLPVFGNLEEDEEVTCFLQSNTAKQVVRVEVSGVCHMGGSARCLSWQVMGDRSVYLKSIETLS